MGKFRSWFESRISGKLNNPQWDYLRGRYSHTLLRAMTKERIETILKGV